MDRGFFVSQFQRFLRAITVGIGIVAIRIVVIRRAGIHGIQHHAEQTAFTLRADRACA